MRIAVVNWSNRMAGGVEAYLRNVIPALRAKDHQVALIHEVSIPPGREEIWPQDRTQQWSILELGAAEVLRKISDWGLDLLFVHGIAPSGWLREIVAKVPSAFFCHDYSGICISGTKTFRTSGEACSRPFGKECLLRYFPYHCGGWSPLTMNEEYQRQASRLSLLRQGSVLITASESMRQAFLTNGFNPGRVHLAPPMAAGDPPAPCGSWSPSKPWRLLFAGRMEWMKGGALLVDALRIAAVELDQPIEVTFAGDGRCRKEWETKAARAVCGNLRISFPGWLSVDQLRLQFDETHLLLMPSLWPEPFGLAGVEAGCHGIPAAAFRSGGIPEWLSDGVNGFTASLSGSRARNFAHAIVRCIGDLETYRLLRAGALEVSSRFSVKRHVESLESIFRGILEQKAA